MIKTCFDKLNEDYSTLLDSFTCQESNDFLSSLGFNKTDRKRIKSHNKDIEAFLKNEALIEQSKNLNTTHLLLSETKDILIGFISLCNDCIPLELDEKESYGFTYTTIPALKIARLAISSEYQHQGYASLLIQYAIYNAMKIRESSGLAFITADCYKHRLDFYSGKLGFVINQIQGESNADDKPISIRLYIDDYLAKIASSN